MVSDSFSDNIIMHWEEEIGSEDQNILLKEENEGYVNVVQQNAKLSKEIFCDIHTPKTIIWQEILSDPHVCLLRRLPGI